MSDLEIQTATSKTEFFSLGGHFAIEGINLQFLQEQSDSSLMEQRANITQNSIPQAYSISIDNRISQSQVLQNTISGIHIQNQEQLKYFLEGLKVELDNSKRKNDLLQQDNQKLLKECVKLKIENQTLSNQTNKKSFLRFSQKQQNTPGDFKWEMIKKDIEQLKQTITCIKQDYQRQLETLRRMNMQLHQVMAEHAQLLNAQESKSSKSHVEEATTQPSKLSCHSKETLFKSQQHALEFQTFPSKASQISKLPFTRLSQSRVQSAKPGFLA